MKVINGVTMEETEVANTIDNIYKLIEHTRYHIEKKEELNSILITHNGTILYINPNVVFDITITDNIPSIRNKQSYVTLFPSELHIHIL